jgi:hypothetical protein
MGDGKPQSVTCGLDAFVGAELVDLIWFGIELSLSVGVFWDPKDLSREQWLCLSL